MSKTSITDLSNLFGGVINASSRQFSDLQNTVKSSIGIFDTNNKNLFSQRGETKSGLISLNTPIQSPSIVFVSPESAESDHESVVAGTGEGINAGVTGSNKDAVILDTVGQKVQPNTAKEQFIVDSVKYKEQVNTKNPTNSGIFMLDFGEYLTNNLLGNIINFLERPLAPLDLAKIFKYILGGNLDKVLPVIVPYISKPPSYDDDIKNLDRALWSTEVVEANNKIIAVDGAIRKTDLSLTSYVAGNATENDSVGVNSRGVIDTSSKKGKRSGRSTDGSTWNFDDINSNEELESMFRNVNRIEENAITGATIHWSATFIDQNIGAEWLNRVHIEEGYDGVGYHIIIKRDGTLQRGRPLNIRGAHDRNNNANFLGFCFVGGVNESAKTASKPYRQYASAKSLTLAQFKGYDNLMRVFHKVFPYAQVVGHYDTTNEGKVDPGFDVNHYSFTKFGHTNIIPEGDIRWNTPAPITLKDVT